VRIPVHALRLARIVLAGPLLLVLAACRGPEAARGAQTPAQPPAVPLAARPQFTFASWSQAVPYIRSGQVIQTVSGQGGFSLILRDHTWVHLVDKPGDPLPRNPRDFIARNAPNAAAIRHSRE